MSEGKPDKTGDSEFERDLALTSQAYKSSDADEPSAAMDDAIRAAARRAVRSQPRTVGRSWISRWSAPLSAAALVVLTVSVGFIALDERPELAPSTVTEAVKPGMAFSVSPVIPKSAPASPQPGVAETRVRPSVEVAEKKAVTRKNPASDTVDQLAQTAAPNVEQPRGETGAVSSGTILAKDTNSSGVMALNSPVAATTPMGAARPMAKEAPAFVADPVASSGAGPGKREMLQEKQLVSQSGVASVSRADTLQVAPAKARAAETSPAPPATVGNLAKTAASNATVAAAAESAAPATSLALADKASEPPESWIKRILEFKQQGKTREFEDELSRFKKRYPDYALPTELKSNK